MISRFDDLVWQAADSYPAPLGMSRDQWFTLINSIIQKESTFNPDAVSWTGAGIGLMQVNPNIWLTTYNVTREALFDPWTNISIGVQIARDYIRKYGTSGGLGAYFAGPAGRLSSSAQAYATKVLSIYSSLLSKVRSLFGMPKAGQSYFIQPTASGENLINFMDQLPETGEGDDLLYEAGYVQAPAEGGDDWILFAVLIGAAVLWSNR